MSIFNPLSKKKPDFQNPFLISFKKIERSHMTFFVQQNIHVVQPGNESEVFAGAKFPTGEIAAHHQAIPASQQLAGVRERHRTQESNRRRSASARLRRERHVDFGVAAGRRGRDGSGHAIRMLAQQRPLRAACDNDERDSACAQVLLVADTAVGGEQEVEAGLFCSA